MGNMKCRLFCKASRDEYPRYWVNISEREYDRYGKATDNRITASMSARLSKAATEAFADLCEESERNPDIVSAWVEITDMWLKPVQTRKEGAENFVVLFINSLEAGDEDRRKPTKPNTERRY